MRNLLERARAKLSRGGGGFNSERGEDLGRLNSGRGDDLLDSAPGSPVHVPRSKWRERLAVPDQQVSNVIQKWDTQKCHPGHRKASHVIFGYVMQASDNMLEGYASVISPFDSPLYFPGSLQVTQSSPNTPLMARKLKSKSRHQSFSPIR